MKRPSIVYPLLILCEAPGEIDALQKILSLIKDRQNKTNLNPLRLGLSIPAVLMQQNFQFDILGEIRQLQAAGCIKLWPSTYRATIDDVLEPLELALNRRYGLNNPAKTGFLDLDLAPEANCLSPWPATAIGSSETGSYLVRQNGQLSLCFSGERSVSIRAYRDISSLEAGVENGVYIIAGNSLNPLEEFAHLERWCTLCSAHMELDLLAACTSDKLQMPADAVLEPIIAFPDNISPDFCAALEGISRHRQLFDTSDATIAQRLSSASPYAQHSPLPGPPPPSPARSLLAAMQGNVCMPGPHFDILFSNGTLRGFKKGRSHLYCYQSPETRHASANRFWETQSAVSLESLNMRGLRETKIYKEKGQVLAEGHYDYLFIEGSDYLYLDVSLRLPEQKSNNINIPTIPLALGFGLDSPIQISWKTNSGQRHASPSPLKSPNTLAKIVGQVHTGEWLHCYGNEWIIRSGTQRLVIAIPGGGYAPMSLRLCSARQGLIIELLPQGYWQSQESTDRKQRHHRFCLAFLPLFDSEQAIPNQATWLERDLSVPWTGLS